MMKSFPLFGICQREENVVVVNLRINGKGGMLGN